MIGFQVKLLSQLAIDGFNDLAHGIEQAARCGWGLRLLIALRQSLQADPIVPPKSGALRARFLLADIAFIADHVQIGMVAQDIHGNFAFIETGAS